MYTSCSQFVGEMVDEDDVGMMGMKMLRACCVIGPDRVITLACFPCRVFGSGGLAGVISRQVEHLPGPRKQPASGVCAIALIL